MILFYIVIILADFTLAAGPFDGWFGIPFPSSLTFTHVRTLHPTEILTFYGLSVLIPLYSI